MTIHVPWIWCSSLPCRVHRFLQMGPKSPWVYQVMVIHDWMIWDFGSPPWLRNLHWRFYVPWIPEKYPIDIPWISIGPWNPGWWFGTFFIFHNIWDNPSHWLIFFRGVETTNQNNFWTPIRHHFLCSCPMMLRRASCWVALRQGLQFQRRCAGCGPGA